MHLRLSTSYNYLVLLRRIRDLLRMHYINIDSLFTYLLTYLDRSGSGLICIAYRKVDLFLLKTVSAITV